MDRFFDWTAQRPPKTDEGELARRVAVSLLDRRQRAEYESMCAVGPQAPCFNNRTKSQTRVAHGTYNRVRVFRAGEVEIRTVSRGSTSKNPLPNYGRRRVRGVSSRGRRQIRRSVSALTKSISCQAVLYTLTSQNLVSDDEFNRRLASFLAWGRKFCPEHFRYYVLVKELQQRGVLHAHLMLFKRIPKPLWRRMRDLWAERYEMGPGSFHARPMRKASRAASYLAKVVSYMMKDGERLGRNGLPYERDVFTGNAYQISAALRWYAAPVSVPLPGGGSVSEFHVPWGSRAVLGASSIRGVCHFFTDLEGAMSFVDHLMSRSPRLSLDASKIGMAS